MVPTVQSKSNNIPFPKNLKTKPVVPFSVSQSKMSPNQSFANGQVIIKLKSPVPTSNIQPSAAMSQTISAGSVDSVIRAHGGLSSQPIFASVTGLRTKNIQNLTANQAAAVSAARARLNNVFLVNMLPNADPVRTCVDFKKDDRVEYCQPNYQVKAYMVPNDPYYASSGSWGQAYDDLWGLKKIQMDKAWDSVQGQGIVVAVVDTGVDYNHPDIASNIWTNTQEIAGNNIDDDSNGYVDDIKGWSFGSGNNDVMDRYCHGTHVAGTIAAIGNNNLGVIGVAPKAKIMPVKGLDDTGNGTIDNLAKAQVYAVDNGADVINNSWGCSGGCPSNPVIEDALRYAYVHNVAVVFSAGNSLTDVSSISPQNMIDSKPVVVAASDQNDKATLFSNFGNLVDVAAPGGGSDNGSVPAYSLYNILSLKAATINSGFPDELIVGGKYFRLAGTSMAAPHVSGLMALLKEQYPAASLDTLKKILFGNVDPVTPFIDGLNYGYGRVNSFKAVLDNQSYILARILSPSGFKDFQPGQTVTIIGDAAAKNFGHYEILAGEGVTPKSWQTTGVTLTGNETLGGSLGTWVVPAGAQGIWTLKLIVHDALGQTKEALVRITTPVPEKTGWPKIFPGFYEGSLVMADIDNDGKQEMFFSGTDDKYIPVLHGLREDGSEMNGFPIRPVTTNNGYYMTTPVIGDIGIPNSGKVIAFIYGGSLYVYDKTGKLLPGWPQVLTSYQYSTLYPVLADLFGDGRKELIIANRDGTQSNGYVHAYFNDGTVVPGWPVKTAFPVYDTVTVADIDGDGKDEVLINDFWFDFYNNTAGNFYAWHGDGSLANGFPVVIDKGSYKSPIAGDIDGDGKTDLIVDAVNWFDDVDRIFAFDGSGKVKAGWPVTTKAPVQSFLLSDIDNDGRPDIVSAQAFGLGQWISIYKGDGTMLPGWPQNLGQILPGSYLLDLKAGNLAGGHHRQIVFSLTFDYFSYPEKNFFAALDYQGNLEAFTPVPIDYDYNYSEVSIGDLAYSGALDLVSLTTDINAVKVHRWAMPGSYNPRLLDWPQHKQNAGHTSYLALPRNTPPVISPILPQKVAQGSPLTLQAQGSDSDGNQIVFTGISMPQGATINPGLLTDVNHDGLVNDLDVQLVSANVGTNKAAYDVNNDGIVDQRDVTLVKADLNKTAVSPGLFSWTPGLSLPVGTYTAKVGVSDGLSVGETTFPIEVYKRNHAPVMGFIPDQTLKENQMISFSIYGADQDGDPLTYSAQDLPKGATFNPVSKVFIWRPDFTQAGTYNLTFKVTDGSLWAQRTVKFTVLDVPFDIKPVIVSGNYSTATNPAKLVINASITNLGSQSPPTKVSFYLSKDQQITSSDIYVGSANVISIPGGWTIQVGYGYGVPAVVGTYYVGAIVNPQNNIHEQNTSNNIIVGNQVIIPGVKVKMTPPPQPAQ